MASYEAAMLLPEVWQIKLPGSQSKQKLFKQPINKMAL